MLVRRWLDMAGITDPVLRHCYTVGIREIAEVDGGRGRWLALRTFPAAARPHTAAVAAHGCRADACADRGPVSERKRRLTRFAEVTWAAFASGESADPVVHAAVHTYRTFGMPPSLVAGMFTAMLRDVDFHDFDTYAELRRWCTQVTGGPILAILWAAVGTDITPVAPLVHECAALGQLTDVLCDLSEDLDEGRLYLPLEDLDRFGVRPEDIRARRWTPATSDLLAFEAERITSRFPALAAELEDSPVGAFIHPIREHCTLLVTEVLAAGQDVLHRSVQPPVGRFLKVWRPLLRSVIPC